MRPGDTGGDQVSSWSGPLRFDARPHRLIGRGVMETNGPGGLARQVRDADHLYHVAKNKGRALRC